MGQGESVPSWHSGQHNAVAIFTGDHPRPESVKKAERVELNKRTEEFAETMSFLPLVGEVVNLETGVIHSIQGESDLANKDYTRAAEDVGMDVLGAVTAGGAGVVVRGAEIAGGAVARTLGRGGVAAAEAVGRGIAEGGEVAARAAVEAGEVAAGRGVAEGGEVAARTATRVGNVAKRAAKLAKKVAKHPATTVAMAGLEVANVAAVASSVIGCDEELLKPAGNPGTAFYDGFMGSRLVKLNPDCNVPVKYADTPTTDPLDDASDEESSIDGDEEPEHIAPPVGTLERNEPIHNEDVFVLDYDEAGLPVTYDRTVTSTHSKTYPCLLPAAALATVALVGTKI